MYVCTTNKKSRIITNKKVWHDWNKDRAKNFVHRTLFQLISDSLR